MPKSVLRYCWIWCKDTESKTLYSHLIEETQLGLELASTSYQSILQEESHTIDLLSIQIDKYETQYPVGDLPFLEGWYFIIWPSLWCALPQHILQGCLIMRWVSCGTYSKVG